VVAAASKEKEKGGASWPRKSFFVGFVAGARKYTGTPFSPRLSVERTSVDRIVGRSREARGKVKDRRSSLACHEILDPASGEREYSYPKSRCLAVAPPHQCISLDQAKNSRAKPTFSEIV